MSGERCGSKTVTFGEKPPYVGFAGDGVILPREDADGVGIETVNVSRLNIEVWRVADRNLVRTSISAPRPESEASITARRGIVGNSFSMAAATRSM